MSDMRTPLARVRGLGSAKEGVHHWRLQRVSALALIPLSLWFVCSVLGKLVHAGRSDIIDWLSSPFVALTLLALLLTAIYHARLGVQVIVEDYVHKDSFKLPLLLINTFASVSLAAIALISICKLHFLGI